MADTLTLPVENIRCGGCVKRAETALEAAPGVTAAEVNLTTSEARFELDGSIAGVLPAMQRAGYPLRQVREVFRVEGMSCASCLSRVEEAALEDHRILSAQVNLADSTLMVVALPAEGWDSALSARLAKRGYPVTRTSETTADPLAAETAQLTRQMLWAVVLGLPVFVLEMGGHIFPAFHHFVAQSIGMQTSWLIQLVLTTLVLIGPGRLFFARGVPALMRGAPDMNSLVALGTGAAFGYSAVATLAPGWIPDAKAGVYFEAAAVIVALILVGRVLEARAKAQTGGAIRALMALRPQTARVQRNGTWVEEPVEHLSLGDQVMIHPGETVSVDAKVITGESFVDEAMLTGEPIPVAKSSDDTVTGGTVNQSGVLIVEVSALGQDTTLAQVIELVRNAQSTRLPVQALVNRIAAVFVPVVLGIACITLLVWLWAGAELSLAVVAAVSVLIIACPCAMGLATPTSIMVGTGRAAESGILFRQGDALQQLETAKVVAFDKTGTLTEGRPTLTDLLLYADTTRADVLRLLGSAEIASEHPVAKALVSTALDEGQKIADPDSIETLPGEGIAARVEGRSLLAGTARLMKRHGVSETNAESDIKTLSSQGKTPILIALDGELVAMAAVADRVRESAARTVATLRAAGLHTVLISGDTPTTAEAVGRSLGIDEVFGGVLPDGKKSIVEDLQHRHGPTVFVGDGINDAPALARADIGIALGSGTDVAIESADVVIMAGDPEGVVRARTISAATLRNIRQNLGWAFGYNVLLIPVAAGVLYPAFGVLLSPMLAAGAMALSSVFVVTNALRLRLAV